MRAHLQTAYYNVVTQVLQISDFYKGAKSQNPSVIKARILPARRAERTTWQCRRHRFQSDYHFKLFLDFWNPNLISELVNNRGFSLVTVYAAEIEYLISNR